MDTMEQHLLAGFDAESWRLHDSETGD